MKDALFDSSDRLRTAAPLRHAQQAVFAEPLLLELGGQLPSVSVTYETYGQLNGNRDNAVLVCHAISGDSHVARHDADDDPGWWELIVGPGKSIDTDRYFVICSNVLGGCRGTTGPNSVDPSTARPYGADFPAITVDDMVEVQRRLVDHLDIATLRAVAGGSLGGHQALTWAIRHPERVRGCVALATSARLTSQALAFDVVGRNAIMHDPGYRGGQYYEHGAGPVVGLALARMLAHITYLSREAMRAKFDPRRLQPSKVATAFENKFAVGSYLAYQGHKFVERFDPNSYVTLSMAMDLFDLGDTRERLRAVFARSQCRWLVVSFSSDWLFPPDQSRQIVDALEKRSIYGGLIREFLAHVDRCRPPAVRLSAPVDAHANAPTSIFHGHRLDYDRILELIPAGASVLDLGCGNGSLLSQLRERGHTRLVGVDLDEDALLACVAQGLDVVQCDIEKGLPSFTNGQFDVVVLSQTLQSVGNTEGVVDEMLRVGRSCIVSFPNFAYRKLRRMLYEEGRSPKAEGAYHFEWYNTPNRRFPSIADVEEFCARKNIQTHRKLYLDSETGGSITSEPNLNADVAIFVLSR